MQIFRTKLKSTKNEIQSFRNCHYVYFGFWGYKLIPPKSLNFSSFNSFHFRICQTSNLAFHVRKTSRSGLMSIKLLCHKMYKNIPVRLKRKLSKVFHSFYWSKVSKCTSKIILFSRFCLLSKNVLSLTYVPLYSVTTDQLMNLTSFFDSMDFR